MIITDKESKTVLELYFKWNALTYLAKKYSKSPLDMAIKLVEENWEKCKKELNDE